MEFAELNDDQRRRLIDLRQLYEARRAADTEFRHSYPDTMRWRRVKGVDYLYRIVGRVERSLGPRNPETERLKADHDRHRDRMKCRFASVDERIKEMSRVNRAAGLGRVPLTAARILRKLDESGPAGTASVRRRNPRTLRLRGVCGHPLRFGPDGDDGRRSAVGRAAAAEPSADRRSCGRRAGALEKGRRHSNLFRTISVRSTMKATTLISSGPAKGRARARAMKIGPAENDLEAAAIAGLQWLINAPRFGQIVVGADGLPLWMSCVDPRAFALHKWWVS